MSPARFAWICGGYCMLGVALVLRSGCASPARAETTIVNAPAEEPIQVVRASEAENEACRQLGACLAGRSGFPLGRVAGPPPGGMLCRVLFSGGPVDLELGDTAASLARCRKTARARGNWRIHGAEKPLMGPR